MTPPPQLAADRWHARAPYVAALAVVLATNLALAYGVYERAVRAENSSRDARQAVARATDAMVSTARSLEQTVEAARATQAHRARAEGALALATASEARAAHAAQTAAASEARALDAVVRARAEADRAQSALLRGNVTLGTPTIVGRRAEAGVSP